MSKLIIASSIAALCNPEALAMLQASPEVAERAQQLGLRNRNGRIGEAEVIEARQLGGPAKGGAVAKAAAKTNGGRAGRSGTRKR